MNDLSCHGFWRYLEKLGDDFCLFVHESDGADSIALGELLDSYPMLAARIKVIQIYGIVFYCTAGLKSYRLYYKHHNNNE